MASESKSVLTGGCQCGAVRFALSAPPARISICHCRMCQKASGAPFASFADIEHADFSWTRGKPAAFKVSGAGVACLCSSDEVYAAHAIPAAQALQAADAKHIYLAGRPGEQEAALRAAGVNDFVFAGGDALAGLQDAWQRMERA